MRDNEIQHFRLQANVEETVLLSEKLHLLIIILSVKSEQKWSVKITTANSQRLPNTPGHFYPVLALFPFQICGALPSFISFAEMQLRYMWQKTVMTGNEDGVNKAQQHCWRSQQEVNWSNGYDRRRKPLCLIVSDPEKIITLNLLNVNRISPRTQKQRHFFQLVFQIARTHNLCSHDALLAAYIIRSLPDLSLMIHSHPHD